METKIYQEMGIVGNCLKWADEHPFIANIILAVECIAMALAVFFYDFTTQIYVINTLNQEIVAGEMTILQFFGVTSATLREIL